jgi:hypothetical protein
MTKNLYIYGGLAVLALLYLKAQKSSASPSGTGQPAWSMTTGPVGPKYNPLTGTVEMAPLDYNGGGDWPVYAPKNATVN